MHRMDYTFLDRPDEQRLEAHKKLYSDLDTDAVRIFIDFQWAYRNMQRQYDSLLEQFDLSESRFIILMFLYQAPEYTLLPSTISEKLGATRATVSKLLKGMEQKGMILKIISDIDKRSFPVKITDLGLEILHKFLPYNFDIVHDFFHDFSKEDIQTLSTLLKKIENRTHPNIIHKGEKTMNTKKLEFLETYLSLYIDHTTVLDAIEKKSFEYVILDIRNAPAQIKKDQIKGAVAIPAKDLQSRLGELDPTKTYVVYDWTAGTTLGKVALQILLSADFKAYELACALEGWKGMNLPIESVL